MNKCVRPAMVSVKASGMPLNGTCTIWTLAWALSNSAANCEPLPVPADA